METELRCQAIVMGFLILKNEIEVSVMNYDVIIIGAGTADMSAGKKRGEKVALIDAHDPPHSEASHHGDTRIIRHAYGEGGIYVSMALRANCGWSRRTGSNKSFL
ncbi:hypothetical protein ACDX78_11660 [Virgibacillus oceani]